ncbi:hypothetical protein [Escherichia sp. E1130]|uniref:hypothetical protein n=1 Tax=Escherichia sp. E1130 TaxID=2041645 RepID=UPI0010FEBD6F|nr:hypothetical protein [Escherichia sp. E1130]
MGMSADDRKDFKNAIIYTNREKIDDLKVSTEKEDEVAKNTPVVALLNKSESAARMPLEPLLCDPNAVRHTQQRHPV